MTTRFLVAFVVALVACGPSLTPTSQPAAVVSPVASPTVSASAGDEVCHGLAHVYNPSRLRVLASCVRVRGVIISARQEPDGDLHVRLKVDADQTAFRSLR